MITLVTFYGLYHIDGRGNNELQAGVLRARLFTSIFFWSHYMECANTVSVSVELTLPLPLVKDNIDIIQTTLNKCLKEKLWMIYLKDPFRSYFCKIYRRQQDKILQ